MRAIQFNDYGAPSDVLRLTETVEPQPGPGQIRVIVHACGINPADWALCGGLFAGDLPRGIGLEVSGHVDAIGEGVRTTTLGAAVLGPATFRGTTAGAADKALMEHWAQVPADLNMLAAAALPMVAETACRSLDELGVTGEDLLFVHGAGSAVGGAAVRLALHRGPRVIATAGPTHTSALEALGAEVTAYGQGMNGRITRLAAGRNINWALDASPVGGSLPDLIALTGDPDRVLTVSDFEAATKLGARVSGASSVTRNDVLPEVAGLAAAGKFDVPIAKTFTLDEFPEAVRLSQSAKPGGKLLFLVSEHARKERTPL